MFIACSLPPKFVGSLRALVPFFSLSLESNQGLTHRRSVKTYWLNEGVRFWAWAHWLHSSQNSDAPRVSFLALASPVRMTYLWLTGKVHGWRVRCSSVPIAWARALGSPWFPSGHHASLDTIMSYLDDSSSLRARAQILFLASSSPLSLLQLWWSWSTEIMLLFSFEILK